jgi:hypothetical protein
MALDVAGDVRDDHGMTNTDPITYRVTCWDTRKGTRIPGTLTSDQLRDHLANCPHDHGMVDTRYLDNYARSSGRTLEYQR